MSPSDKIEIVDIDTGWSPSGMSLATTLHTTYGDLVDKFGEPEKSDGEDKVQVFWEVSVDYRDKTDMDKYKHEDIEGPWKEGDDLDHDTVHFQVYDWKDDRAPEDVTEWNVAARREEKWDVSEVLDAIFDKGKVR